MVFCSNKNICAVRTSVCVAENTEGIMGRGGARRILIFGKCLCVPFLNVVRKTMVPLSRKMQHDVNVRITGVCIVRTVSFSCQYT